mgnify:CR=1 FL=1
MGKKHNLSHNYIDDNFLKENDMKYYSLLDIEKEIETTRELLNEVSCDIDDIEKSQEILKVSQYMDKLLNKYTTIVASID